MTTRFSNIHLFCCLRYDLRLLLHCTLHLIAGIIKNGTVFGSTLQELKTRDGLDIPLFVSKCIQSIETDELLKTEGIYRKSGSAAQIQAIRIKVDEGNLRIFENQNIHVLTGALKLFFRELKEPLIISEIVEKLFEATKLKQKYTQMKAILNTLPQTNKATLSYLMKHLYEVTKFCNENKMEYSNIAIVFGPTLMWRNTDDRMSLFLVYLEQQKTIIKEILLGYDEIFPLLLYDDI